LEKIGRDVNATWTKLDQIEDPETGLALLSKRSGEETPEQEQKRIFWQFQFMQMRDWRAGDVLAVSRALTCCSLLKRPPPRWLRDAIDELCERNMSADEKRARRDGVKHFLRWQAVELVRGRYPGHPRNYKRKVHGDAVWTEAAKLVASTDAEASAETVRKSHALIRRAGGAWSTFLNYKREVEEHGQRRKKKSRG
jgi:hypothetical protein